MPTNATAANTLKSEAKVIARSTVSLIAGSQLTVASSGVLEVNGDSHADQRTITLSSGDNLTFAGPIGQAIDSGDKVELPASVTVSAKGDVNLKGATISARDKITAHAGSDGSGGILGDVTTQLKVTNAGSDIQLTAGSNSGAINLTGAAITATDRIDLQASGGDILHSGARITADQMHITGGANVTANTHLATLNATLTKLGNLAVTNHRSLTATSVTNANGSISLTTYGNLIASNIQTTGGTDVDDIVLSIYPSSSVTNPGLTLTTVSAAGQGDVTVTRPSTVTQSSGKKVVADQLTITVDGALNLATQVKSLGILATGDVALNQSGSGTLTVTELTVADGAATIAHPSGNVILESVQLATMKDKNDLTVTAGGDIQLGNVRASLYYQTPTEAGSNVITALGDVTLTAGKSINEYGDDATVDLVGDQLTLAAQTGITNLEIAANELLSVATNSGNITITEYDSKGESQPGLLVTNASATNGSVTISAEDSLRARRVVAGNATTGMLTLESRNRNLLIGDFHSDGTTLVKPTSLSTSQHALQYGYGLSLSASKMLDTYQFFDAKGHLEYQASGAFNFNLPNNLSAETIVLHSGPALKIQGKLTATKLVELSSSTNVYVVGSTIESPTAGNVATVRITALGNRNSQSAVYDQGTGLQKYVKTSDASKILLVATTDGSGNLLAPANYTYYREESDGTLTNVSSSINPSHYKAKIETIVGGQVDLDQTSTIRADLLDLRALNNVKISKNGNLNFSGFVGGLTGRTSTAKSVDLTVNGTLNFKDAYIASESGTVTITAAAITTDKSSLFLPCNDSD